MASCVNGGRSYDEQDCVQRGGSSVEVGGSWFAEVVDYIEGPRSSPDMRHLNTHMLRPGLSDSCLVDIIYDRL